MGGPWWSYSVRGSELRGEIVAADGYDGDDVDGS